MATYNATIPLQTNSPSVFPAQSQGNFNRLQTIIGADHQFNLTEPAPPSNDGYHNLIHMTIQAPSGNLASTGRLYVKSVSGRVNLFYMDDQATAYQLSPGMPIRAAVNFDGTGATGAQTMRSQYNVASVTKSAAFKYRIAFTTAMPDANYIVQVTGMRLNTDGECCGQVWGASSTPYGTSVTTTYVDIGFNRGSSTYVGDVIMGNVTIFSVA